MITAEVTFSRDEPVSLRYPVQCADIDRETYENISETFKNVEFLKRGQTEQQFTVLSDFQSCLQENK
jgi:hypothetical protein